jgi:phosphoribosyl-dephospho-CoA transferase
VIESLRRHDLLRVSSTGWQRALEPLPGIAARPFVREWVDHGWPVMVRRFQSGDVADLIPVAIALPPAAGKPGPALQLQADDILERLPPLALSACVDAAPVEWRGSVRELERIALRLQSNVAVFGSLLWQTLTALSYLRESSDLDLTWSVARAGQARALAGAIAQCANDSPMRIDGEFVLPDGAGVHWREWLDGADEVVAKTLRGVESRSLEGLFVVQDRMLSC